ncbi:MAG TPA: hypothetical protein VMX17_08770 [Candidatus Glassbacteria bacterium]|jgi:hypothetical protein|nr:hypothetical protein [Candidatus Glassbacteria bacterium]
MNNYDEIKMLVEASRRALSGKLNENRTSDIRRQYGLIIEQFETDEVEIDDINIDEKPKKDSDEIGVRKDKQKAFRVLNNIIILHGKTKADLQLTTDEKNALTSSVDEFRTDVAELVDFGDLNVYHDNVEWKGKILEINLEFFFSINEPNGLYIKGDMIKIDQDYVEMVSKLQSYYEKFKTKWSKIVASRQEDVEE